MKTVLMVIGGIVVVFVVICVGLIAVASFSGTASTSRTPVVTKATPGTTAGDESSAEQQATVAQIGDRVEVAGVALTVVGVDSKGELGSLKAKDGMVYLVTEVVVENTGKDEAPYNPMYFKVKDADGFEYNSTINIESNALKSGDLTQGDKARGTVAFEVKENATGLVLSYEPIVLLGGYEPIKVSLDQ